MDYDDVIERAKAALCAKAIEVANEDKSEDWFADQYIRAAAPILMEYGARLMREAVLPDVQTERTIENHGGNCRCTTCELNITEDSILTIDPAAIVKEVVK